MSDYMIDAADRYIDDVQEGATQAHIYAMNEARIRLDAISEQRSKLNLEERQIHLRIAAAIGASVGDEIDYGDVTVQVTRVLWSRVEHIDGPEFRVGEDCPERFIASAQVEVAPATNSGTYHKTKRLMHKHFDERECIFNPRDLDGMEMPEEDEPPQAAGGEPVASFDEWHLQVFGQTFESEWCGQMQFQVDAARAMLARSAQYITHIAKQVADQ